jgi:HK97 family phage prohead protease
MSEERLTRMFAAELDEGDGRTLFGRIIPYDQMQRVADMRRDGSFGPPYEETIARGAFAKDARLWKAPNRVRLTAEHGQSFMDNVGHGVEFEDRPDGLYGTFRALASAPGEQALAMFRAGILKFFSVEMGAKRQHRKGDVVVRTAARIIDTSLVEDPAYKGTEVAVRSKPAIVQFEVPERNTDLDRRLSVLGFSPKA